MTSSSLPGEDGQLRCILDIVPLVRLRKDVVRIMTTRFRAAELVTKQMWTLGDEGAAEILVEGAKGLVVECHRLIALIEPGLGPATERDIVEEVVLLGDAIGGKQVADKKVYSRSLIQTVLAEAPTRLAVRIVFAKLREERETLPSLRAVMVALKEEQQAWPRNLGCIRKLPDELQKCQGRLAREQRSAARGRGRGAR